MIPPRGSGQRAPREVPGGKRLGGKAKRVVQPRCRRLQKKLLGLIAVISYPIRDRNSDIALMKIEIIIKKSCKNKIEE